MQIKKNSHEILQKQCAHAKRYRDENKVTAQLTLIKRRGVTCYETQSPRSRGHLRGPSRYLHRM